MGVLGITSMVVGAISLADYEYSGYRIASKEPIWSGQRMMRKADNIMKQFASTWEAAAFRTAVETAITNKDYTWFIAAHTQYKVNTSVTQEQFDAMIARRENAQQSLTALKNWDYATWKSLNKDTPIIEKITTEAQFKKLQEMEAYKEKMDAISKDLGIGWPKGEGMGILMELEHGRGMGRWMQQQNEPSTSSTTS